MKARPFSKYWYEYSKAQQFIALFALSLVVLLAILIPMQWNRTRFSVDGVPFRLRAREDTRLIFADGEGNEAVLNVWPSNQYLGEISYRGEELIGRWDDLYVSYASRGESIDGRSFMQRLFTGAYELYDRRTGISWAVLCFFAGAAVMALGAGCVANPEAIWKLSTFMTVQGGEPTDFALAGNRVGGAAIILMGFAFAIILMQM